MRFVFVVIIGAGLCTGCIPLFVAGGVNSIYSWEKHRALEKRVQTLEQRVFPKQFVTK